MAGSADGGVEQHPGRARAEERHHLAHHHRLVNEGAERIGTGFRVDVGHRPGSPGLAHPQPLDQRAVGISPRSS